MDINLKGKSVLITGASKGIGFVIAEHMAAEGCNLHLAARDDKAHEGAGRAARPSEHGVKVTVHRCDLGQTAEVEALGKACADVDILVNNAGDIPPGTLTEIDGETWRKAWDVKVFGYVDLTRIIYPHMCARKSGVIVNIIGAAARMPEPPLHRRLHGQHRAQHVHAVPRRREHAPRRARGRHQSGADGAGPASAARHGARQAAVRRREPLAGAAREISLRPRRQGLRDRRGGRLPRLRPRRASSAAPRSTSTAAIRCTRRMRNFICA